MKFLSEVPDILLYGSEQEILDFLRAPTLLFMDMKAENTVLVAGLLHGNEPSGFRAILHKLREVMIQQQQLLFNLLFFFGNPEAARHGPFKQRYRDGGEDMNRIWPENTSISQEMARLLRPYNIILGLDLHNTSGKSPVFGVMTSRTVATVTLARVLTLQQLYIDQHLDTFIEFLGRLSIPAIVVECGQLGTEEADAAAVAVLNRFLEYARSKVERQPIMICEGPIYAETFSVKVLPDVAFSFGQEGAVRIRPDLEDLNFQRLQSGTCLAEAKEMPFVVVKNNEEHTDSWFDLVNDMVVLKRDAVVIMATTHMDNIRKDNLLYLAQPQN